MSIINVDSISDAAGTGSPSFPNGISLNSLTTTGTVTAGDITLDNTNPIVKSADADGFLTLSGGTTTSLGTQIRLYSESHATAANDLTFRSGGSAVLIYNASTPVWNFQAEDITTTGTVTATSYAGDGSSLTGIATTPTSAQVGTATAGLAAGAVGTYAALYSKVLSTQRLPNSTLAGSDLGYTNFNGGSHSTLSGTWRIMGIVQSSTAIINNSNVWLRIA